VDSGLSLVDIVLLTAGFFVAVAAGVPAGLFIYFNWIMGGSF
jgi:hypothetical protein